MSRYKPYGKSKSHSGGGFQFDKLLKVCSNSKKAASATKTVGSLGRFGNTNFTSTRNSNLDSAGEDDRDSLYKRPKLDVQSSYGNSSGYGYSEDQYQNIPGTYASQENFPGSNNSVATPFKPKKFFKSRNPLGVVEPKPLGVPASSRPESTTVVLNQQINHTSYVPPITIPVPKKSSDSEIKQSKKKSRKATTSEPRSRARRKDGVPTDSQAVTNDTRGSPSRPAPEINLSFTNNSANNSSSLTSPSIKLRIFKDKTTSTFVSVSDLPPANLAKQASPEKKKKEKKKPEKVKRKQEPSRPEPEMRPTGRVTRSSKRLARNSSSSDVPMPTLRRVSENSSRENDQNSSIELVKKLEEEDDEFRQMSAMLSSMESDKDEGCTSLQPESNQSNIDHSNNSVYSPLPEETIPSTPPPRDIRDILDEWDDDEESPRKGSQTPKYCNVTRFDMAAFMPEKSKKMRNTKDEVAVARVPLEVVKPSEEMGVDLSFHRPNSGEVFNAPYAVRNLLADFTDVKQGSLADEASVDVQPEVTSVETVQKISTRSGAKKGPAENHQSKQSSTAVRKGSIFKSRAAAASDSQTETTSPKKRLALYKHKFGQESGDKSESPEKKEGAAAMQFTEVEEEVDSQGIRIKNVKATHELQESGEAMEFDGDILYILDDLKDKNPITSRCLSAITLAMRCMEPGFRMHLRAHGTVGEFCKELHDAPNNPVLALLSATVLFVLSQDRLNMDLDTDSLQLLLALTKIQEQTHLIDESPEISKHRQRVIDLVSEMKQRGHAKNLKIERISASEIALETLLHLTSKRAGEWVKRELRSLGGLDYIVYEVNKLFHVIEDDFMSANNWTEQTKERLSKIDRCLRVLEQVSFNHEENQRFLLGVAETSDANTESMAVRKSYSSLFVKMFKFFTNELDKHPKDSEVAQALQELLFSVIRVLGNLTHDYRGIVLGSEILSAQEGLIDLTLYSVFNLSKKFHGDKVFDLLMHSLSMLLNLIEISRVNRNKILQSTIDIPDDNGTTKECSSLDAFIQLFLAKESEAKKEESRTDDILTNSAEGKDKPTDDEKSDAQRNSQDKDSEGSSLQDVIDTLIQTAGKHMENSLISANLAVLIAFIIMDDADSIQYVRSSMPDGKFLPLMVFLKKLFNFMSITSSVSGSTRGLKAISVALKFFQQQDPASFDELKKIVPD